MSEGIPLTTYPEGTYVRYLHWRSREYRGRYGVVTAIRYDHEDHYGRVSRYHTVFLIPDEGHLDRYQVEEGDFDDDELEAFTPTEEELARILTARLLY
jgi:hypothetical protein